ncbi:MAG: hypothetical protein AAFU60_15200, partial [Bacteroidota bacterium]
CIIAGEVKAKQEHGKKSGVHFHSGHYLCDEKGKAFKVPLISLRDLQGLVDLKVGVKVGL